MSDDHNSTDEPAGSPPSGDGAPEHHSGPREDEVSLLDILLILARNKTLIVRTVLAFTLLGVTYSILAPLEYTSETKVVRESEGKGPDISGGLGGLAGGLAGGAVSGLLGGASSGLGPDAFPEVLQGRAVRLAVVRDTFRFPDAERPMTYADYANRPSGKLNQVLRYTLWLPWTLKGMLGEFISRTPASSVQAETGGKPLVPTEKEKDAMQAVDGMISASVDQETGLLTISVTAKGPQLASELVESFLNHFKSRIREIRTEKVRERLQFVEGRFQQVKEELEIAEEQLAQFLERNQNPTTATLQFRRDRLQRQVRFKEQLYSELQSQLTQTRFDLQQRQPVVTVVEEAVPPTSRSAPRRTLIVLLSVILGGILAVAGVFLKAILDNAEKNEEEQEKLLEIKENLIPESWMRSAA